jgi:hypothetical protein
MTTDNAISRPYPDNPGQTHYPRCWMDRGHHNCAVAEALKARHLLRCWLDWAEAHETKKPHLTRVQLEQMTRELLGENDD